MPKIKVLHCKERWESVDYLLIHWWVATDLWGFIEALLVSGKGAFLGKQSKKTWIVSPLCVISCILGGKEYALKCRGLLFALKFRHCISFYMIG